MKIFSIFVFTFMLNHNQGYAKYSPLPLYYMALAADKVIHARIVKHDMKYFYVVPMDSGSNEVTRVLKFVDWPCSQRWKPYEVGQQVFLLLEKENEVYRIMSAGGEGEIPVLNDSVSLDYRSLPLEKSWLLYNGLRSDSLEKLKCQIGNKFIYGRKFSISELEFAISRLREIFGIRKEISICTQTLETCRKDLPKQSENERLFLLALRDMEERKIDCEKF